MAQRLSHALRKARAQKRFTQAELAERAGIATEAYGRIERGLVLPRADTLLQLAMALDVSCDALLRAAKRGDGLRVAEERTPYNAVALTRRLKMLSPSSLQAIVHLVDTLHSERRGRR